MSLNICGHFILQFINYSETVELGVLSVLSVAEETVELVSDAVEDAAELDGVELLTLGMDA